MKKIPLLILFCLGSLATQAQVTCSATAATGSGYPAFTAAGFGIEDPDCVHAAFGPHITQVYDAELDRNVFVFHSHIVADNDRCQVFDRVRMEIKGGPGTDAELQHNLGDTSYYRWKFRLDENFVGTSSFCHIFQNKAVGGADSDFPLLTLTPRANVLEFRHSGGDTGADLGVLAQADLALFRGKWVEGYLKQVHSETGELMLTLKDMQTGITLLTYSNSNIDLWRLGATYNRPKWGMYRLKNDVLQDEDIRFADFCVSEVASTLCPEEAVLQPDTTAPTSPTNLLATNVTISSVDLSWNAATDVYGVVGYDVWQDGQLVQSTAALAATISNLSSATAYTFNVQARDAAGNISAPSNAVTITTDPASALPGIATDPAPGDGATGISNTASLSWTAGSNADSQQVYFGDNPNPPLVSTQSATTYLPALAPSTTYYWRIVGSNENGETSSPIWSFVTGTANADSPWEVYRANARMEEETNFWVLNAAPTVPALDEVVADPNGSDNRYYGYHSNTGENFRWRYALADTDTTLTIVARFKAVAPAVNGICYFDMREFGWRQKVRIDQTSIKLEKTSPVVEADVPFNWNDELHVVRLTVNGSLTTIYLDENPVLFVSGSSSEASAINFFEWGNSGGADYGAYLDWLAVDKTGAFAPGEGTPLPADLFLSSDATLSTLTVDGTPIVDFSPYVLDYTVELATAVVPELSWATSSTFATAVNTNPATVPNTQATILVTAKDGLTTKNYTINYTAPTGTREQQGRNSIRLFPNPTQEQLHIALGANQSGTGQLFTLAGQPVGQAFAIPGQIRIDVAGYPKGIYVLTIKLENGQPVSIRFILT